MHTFKNSTVPVLLRISIIVCLSIFFLASAAVGLLQGTFMNTGITAVAAENGLGDVQGLLSDDKLLSLNGSWEYYPHVFEVKDKFNYRLLNGSTPTQAQFPLENIHQAKGPATYRLLLQTDCPVTNYGFYLENYGEDFAIYVNGIRVRSIWGSPADKLLYSLSDYIFRIDHPVEAGMVEIIISANSSKEQSLLYRNSLIFGHADDIADYTARIWRDDTFLIGMIMVMVIIGLVFVLFRTKFDMLTGIALFDTFLAIRILMGYHVATYFLHSIFPMQLSNVAFNALQYVAFFLAGILGCLLSQSIFDPQKSLSFLPIKVQIIVCATGCMFTLIFYSRFPSLCIIWLFLVLLGSFLIVTWHIINLLKHKKLDAYYLFQITKTYYVGAVMVLDVLNLQGTSYNAMIYAYVLFLFAHLAARIIDNNASYKEVELLNRNLEKMIENRTSQLTETNRCLSELSVRDPLTQAHNRLYFEKTIEELLSDNANASMFLCMFDLDHFKKINDTFGHIAGDDQLKFVVQTVHQILGSRGVFSRVGGEEFVILLPGESKESVLSLLEQIRRRLSEEAQINEKRTTASFGVVRYQNGNSSKDMMRAADKCLYMAKKIGRNCIVME